MSYDCTITIWCDAKTSDTCYVSHEVSAEDIDDARESARRANWQYDGGPLAPDVCPACVYALTRVRQ